MILTLLACTEPGLLGTLQEDLAADTVAQAAPGLRMMMAVGGIVAETCGVSPLGDGDGEPGHVPGSAFAAEIGADDTAFVTVTTGIFAWESDHVGLDGARGTLEIDTEDRETWTFSYVGPGDEVIAGTLTLTCEEGATSEAAVAGTANRSVGDDKDALSLIGEEPWPGIFFSPTSAPVPDSGQARWSRTDAGTKLTLDDASAIDIAAWTWPGVASGKGWELPVSVPLP